MDENDMQEPEIGQNPVSAVLNVGVKDPAAIKLKDLRRQNRELRAKGTKLRTRIKEQALENEKLRAEIKGLAFEGANQTVIHQAQPPSLPTEAQQRPTQDAGLHPACPDRHSGKKAAIFSCQLANSMETLFGDPNGVAFPRGLVLGRWLKRVAEPMIDKHYPNLRRSAARAVMEGLLGVEKPMVAIPIHAARQVDDILRLLDLFETMVWDQTLKGHDDAEEAPPKTCPVGG